MCSLVPSWNVYYGNNEPLLNGSEDHSTGKESASGTTNLVKGEVGGPTRATAPSCFISHTLLKLLCHTHTLVFLSALKAEEPHCSVGIVTVDTHLDEELRIHVTVECPVMNGKTCITPSKAQETPGKVA